MPSPDRARAASPVRRVLRPVRGHLSVAMLLQAFGAVLVLAPLVGVGELGRVLLDPTADADAAHRIVLLSAVGLAVGFTLRGTSELVAELADNALALRLRRDVADALARAPALGSGSTSDEHVQTVMRDDVRTMHHLVAHSGPDLVRATATAVAIGVYLTWTAWELAVVLLLPIAVYLWLYRRMMAGSASKMVAYGQALRDISDAVGSFTQGIAVVKRYGGVDRAHGPYRDASRRFTEFFLGWARPLVVPETLSVAVVAPVTLTLLVVATGTGLVGAGRLDGVDLLPAVVLVPSLSAPLATLVSGARALQMGRGAAGRIAAMLDLPPLPEPTDPVTPDGGRLTFDEVDFAYDERRLALHGVSVTFDPGTVTAVVGPSGSGKSTLAGLALRLADPDRGSVRLGGVPLDRIAAPERAGRITAVLQDVQLLRATVRDNLTLGAPGASEDQVVAAATAARIHDRIVQLPDGYDTVLGDEIDLSGGEAQRLSIARALLVDADVLLLDEPTSAADPHAQQAIQRAFATLLARRADHQAVVVIAHRLETIRGADRIVVLDGGRVVQQGTHDELVTEPGRYRQLWRAQHAADDGDRSRP